jgi:hypothetical protein
MSKCTIKGDSVSRNTIQDICFWFVWAGGWGLGGIVQCEGQVCTACTWLSQFVEAGHSLLPRGSEMDLHFYAIEYQPVEQPVSTEANLISRCKKN